VHGVELTDHPLAGGVGTAGRVFRRGDVVERPALPQTPTVQALLRHARSRGFDGVPEPLGVAAGQEWLAFVDGDVPIPPFPSWARDEQVLTTTAALLRGFHEAGHDFVAPPGAVWNTELADRADPALFDVIGHNDVCPENVVYRDGSAVALIDFEFAAPGRSLYDLAQLAKYYVPVDDPVDAARNGFGGMDPYRRLRLVADAYGLPPGRRPLLDVLLESAEWGADFVAGRIARGEEAFIAMWERMGGRVRYERRTAWIQANWERLLDAVG
jgi:hypothetical protein